MTIKTDLKMNRRNAAGLFAAIIGSATAAPRTTWAQDGTPTTATPAASPAATPTSQTATISNLMRADIEQLPPAPFTVRLLRITLQPDAITPMHSHHGPEIDLIESGEVTIRSQGDAPVTRADGKEEVSTGTSLLLKPGDSVHFPAEIGMFFENTGSEPAVMLSAVVIPVGPDYVNERITWLEGEPSLDGVSYQKLGDGLVQELEQQAASWTVDTVTLPSAVEMPALKGVSMITPVSGNLSFKIEAGQVQVTRAESNMLQPNAVLGTSFSLGDGDAAFFPNGVEATARNDEADELVLLSMDIVPETPGTASAAILKFSEGDGTIAGLKPVDVIGTIVTTNIDGVNMREEPSVDADVVDQFDEGITFKVTEGPTDADDYTWYRVRVEEEDGLEGWIVADFLDGLPEKTSTKSSGGDGTETSTAGFKKGDTVVTSEESVRLRPEPNTGSEAIDALDLGTELTVTGETVKADEYTWLPVSTADGLEGYVVVEFVTAQP